MKKHSTTIARTLSSTSYNSGRAATFQSKVMQPFIEAYQYSAILDGDTSSYCEAHNGQIIKASDPALNTLRPPAHFNCRSTLIPVLSGEGEEVESPFQDYGNKLPKWNAGSSGSVPRSKGFGGT